MSYSEFFKRIHNKQIKTIFELGSRDLIDAIKLLNYFESSNVYAFECNPDCLVECNKNILNFKFVSSNKFGEHYPDLSLKGFSEFDALFVNDSVHQ